MKASAPNTTDPKSTDSESTNPYSPPGEADSEWSSGNPQPGCEADSLHHIAPEHISTVTNLAYWMRLVSIFFYVGAALTATMGLGAWLGIGRLAGPSLSGDTDSAATGVVGFAGLSLLLFALLTFFAAGWLRQAAAHFLDGILSPGTDALAQGFRKLRLYLLLYGVFTLLGLVQTVVQLVRTSQG